MISDQMIVGAISIGVSLGLLALMWVWASLPSAQRAVTPAPDRPGKRYRCYCWSEPVVVFIEAPPAPTIEAPSFPRIEAPPEPRTEGAPTPGDEATPAVPSAASQPPEFGAPPEPRISPPAPRGRHAKPRATDHASRPDSASLAGAGGGGRGAPPVHAVV